MFSELTQKLDSYLDIGLPFYDCAVMQDGKTVYRHANGYTDPHKTQPVTGQELYNIYSCTKLITCTAALQLLEKGMFLLDDKLSDYMPEFEQMTVRCSEDLVPSKNPILIRHLFTMTAGFSYNLYSPMLNSCREETNGVCQTRDVMQYLAKEPLLFEPGERWEYSLCHDVLAALIEVLTGDTFGSYVKKNIFDPLGMMRSTFLLEDDQLGAIVNQYAYSTEKSVYERDRRIDYKLGSAYESGGAGCISTVDDYLKFLEALRCGNQILKQETVDLMATEQLSQTQRRTYWNQDYGYGLGQRCPMNENKSDFGWGGAAGAYYAVDRKNRISVYLATHILGFGAYQERRGEILPIIQRMLA